MNNQEFVIYLQIIMKLCILISTIGKGIDRIPNMLLPERNDVQYVISWQTGCVGKEDTKSISDFQGYQELFSQRNDVKLVMLHGKGLSRNRNNALSHSEGDICLIADDDCHYNNEYFDSIIDLYKQNPDIDIALFRVINSEGKFHKKYPEHTLPYKDAVLKGYFPSSVEMTFRKKSIGSLRFNELFGLGSDYLCCGEEDVFLHDAINQGLNIQVVPKVIVMTGSNTTGVNFLSDIKVQRSKGATFRYCFGRSGGLWHCVKEALHHLVYTRINPLPLFKNMLDGYNYCNSNI